MFNDIKILNNFAIFQKIKQLIFIIFLCSLIINLLTIAVSFYSMQIFDKVLNSSSLETLLYLTLLTIIFIFFIRLFLIIKSIFLNMSIGKFPNLLCAEHLTITNYKAQKRRQLCK